MSSVHSSSSSHSSHSSSSSHASKSTHKSQPAKPQTVEKNKHSHETKKPEDGTKFSSETEECKHKPHHHDHDPKPGDPKPEDPKPGDPKPQDKPKDDIAEQLAKLEGEVAALKDQKAQQPPPPPSEGGGGGGDQGGGGGDKGGGGAPQQAAPPPIAPQAPMAQPMQAGSPFQQLVAQAAMILQMQQQGQGQNPQVQGMKAQLNMQCQQLVATGQAQMVPPGDQAVISAALGRNPFQMGGQIGQMGMGQMGQMGQPGMGGPGGQMGVGIQISIQQPGMRPF